MAIRRIMIVGAGFMGNGIAQVAAEAGYEVVLQDITEEFVKKGMTTIENNLQRKVDKAKLSTDEKAAVLARIATTTELMPARDVDLVIEAIVENKQIKIDLFKELDGICPPDVIFASNTSSYPITELAAATKRQENFLGTHFFSPVPVMKLVEIIKGLKTSPETAATVKEFTDNIGKVGIFVKDGPGFLVNRVNVALRNEAAALLVEGVATVEDIDTALKLGLGHPMGPFELGDFAGLDVQASVNETLFDHFKESKWRAAQPLKKLVAAGDLGRKTGKGWYDYTSGEKKPRKDLNL